MKLKQLALIQMGYPFRSRLERSEQGNVSVIQMKDIDEHSRLRTEDLVRVLMPDVKEHHLVLPQDIVFRSRGYTTTSALIHQDPGAAILAAPLLRIRVKKRQVLPSYLNWYINQSTAQAYLTSRAKGTSVPMISKHAVEEMEVIVPPLERQKRIVELAALASTEQRLLKKLAEKRNQYMRGILMQFALE